MKYIAIINGGFAFKSYEYKSEGIRIIRISDFNNDSFINKSIVRVKEDAKFEPYVINNNDILMCMTGGTVGKSLHVKQLTEKMYTNQRVADIKINLLLDSDYLYNYLISPYIKEIINISKNSTNDNISMDTINNFIIAIPPYAEQRRIIDKLDLINSLIIEYSGKYLKLRLLNDNYKENLKKSILQYAIQGKLVEQNDSDEPAPKLIERILDEKRKLMKEKKIKKENLSIIYKDSSDNQFYEKFDDNQKPINIQKEILFELPSGWEWTRLRNIGIYKKGPFGSALTKNIFVPKGKNTIKVYEQKNAIYKNDKLGDYYITEKYFNEKMKSFEVKTGDIIVSCAGTIGETYILPENIEKGIINQALMRMNISNEINIYYFLLYFDYVLKRDAKTNSKGSAIKNIPPFNIFKEYLIPIPPAEEQERIIKKLNKFNSIIETAE